MINFKKKQLKLKPKELWNGFTKFIDTDKHVNDRWLSVSYVQNKFESIVEN